jgi:ElaB/YqjD/DUF883 family membrane-anchored ribosome-binding protein
MTSLAGQTIVRLKNFHARDVGSRVSNAAGSLADHLVSGVQGWTSKAKSAAEATDGFVRSRPWPAVGAVALAGIAAGILLSRSARRARKRAATNGNVESTSEVLGG